MQITLKRLSLALIAMFALGLAVQPVAAQLSPDDMIARLDGLQTAYARKYIADRELGFATPVTATPSTPDVMLITVLEFDTEENAASAFDGMMNGLVAKLILGEPDMDIDERIIDGLGDQALLYTGTADFAGEPRSKALLAVQDGTLGFLITAHGGDTSTPQMLQEIAEHMVNAEPGADGITINDIGATGGTFDIMPNRDDADLLRGLVPMYDYDLRAPGGSEHPLEHIGHPSPEASPAR